MINKSGKYLISLNEEFIAEDGNRYRAVYGECKFHIPDRKNHPTSYLLPPYYLIVGDGGQYVKIREGEVEHALKTDVKPKTGLIPSIVWSQKESKGVPTEVYTPIYIVGETVKKTKLQESNPEYYNGKYLINLRASFYGEDGNHYDAVYGECTTEIINKKSPLYHRSNANFIVHVEGGGKTIELQGCRIRTSIRTEVEPKIGMVPYHAWGDEEFKGVETSYRSSIYVVGKSCMGL